MNASDFVENFTASDLVRVISETRAPRIKQRLSEAGLFPKYADPVGPEDAARFIIFGCILPTAERARGDAPGAEAYIGLYNELLSRERSNFSQDGEYFPPEITSLKALAQILADPGTVERLEINLLDGAMNVTETRQIPIDDEPGRPKGRFHRYTVKTFYPGLQSGGDDGQDGFQGDAASVAVIKRGGLDLLHQMTK